MHAQQAERLRVGNPEPLPIHLMAKRLWAPMLGMGVLALVVGLIVSFVWAGEESRLADAGAWTQGLLFLGDGLLLVGISMVLATILYSLRQGGGEVQESLGVTVKTLKMPRTARAFIGLMMLGLVISVTQFILSIVSTTEQGRVVQMIALGERVAGWQLVAFEPPGTEGSGVLRFRHHEHGRVDLELRPPPSTGLIGRLVVRTNDPSVLDGERRHVGAQAYPLDDEGRRWRMTAQELRWWRQFGRSMVWKPLGVEPHESTQGDVDGVTIRTSPLAGTPLVGSRGVERGDVVHSVNGETVRTKDELLVAIVLAWRTQNRVRLRVSRTGVARTVEFLFPNR